MAFISGAVGPVGKSYRLSRGSPSSSPSREGSRYLFRGRVYRRLYKLPQYTGEGEECLCCTLEDGCCGAVASLLCVVYLLVLIFSVQKSSPVRKTLQTQQDPETDFGTPVYVSRPFLDYPHYKPGYLQHSPFQSHCRPRDNFVFIRHNQSANPILTNILQRFGDARGSKFAIPECVRNRTTCYSLLRVNPNTKYNIICDSIRFSKQLLNFMPVNSMYFTMVRNPLKKLSHENCSHPLVSDSLQSSYCDHEHVVDEMSHNLGLNVTESFSSVISTLTHLKSQLDFVLIEEYFEESLLLLRKEMCWTFNDILYFIPRIKSFDSHKDYFSKNCYNDQSAIMAAMNTTLDMMLYRYFNRSFWRRLRHYGGDLERDLLTLRFYVQLVSDACYSKLLQEEAGFYHNTSTVITEPSLEYCQKLVKSNDRYSRYLSSKTEHNASRRKKRRQKSRV